MSQNILPCLGCFHCWVVAPGQCVHPDAMGGLLEQVLDADVLVCATPIYYFSMSSVMKMFFERTFPLTKPGTAHPAAGLTRNSIRHPERWRGKKIITLVTGALRDLEVYRPANETFKLIADSLDLELGGQLTRPEAYLLDYPLSKPKTLKRIEAAFVQAGKEAGATGRLTAATMAEASLPLSPGAEHFRTYSNVLLAAGDDDGRGRPGAVAGAGACGIRRAHPDAGDGALSGSARRRPAAGRPAI